MKKNNYLIEIFLGFFIFDCVNFLFFRNNPAFIGLRLHPYWIIVILIPSRYGFFPGLLVSFVAFMHMMIFTFKGLPTRYGVEKIIESGGLLVPCMFVVVGAILGSIRQRYMEKERADDKTIKDKEEAVKLLEQRCRTIEKAQKVLEARIVGETTTVKALYDTAKRLETLNTSGIYAGCLNILAEHFQVQKSSLYIREGNYYVLKAHYGWTDAEAVEGKVMAAKSIMNLAFDTNKTITVKDIVTQEGSHKYFSQYGQVLAMFPLKNEKQEPIGLINVEKMDFMLFTKPNLQLIELVVDWVSLALYNKQLYDKARAGMFWDEQLGVYSFSHFNDALEDEFRRAKHYNLDLTVCFIKLVQYGFYSDDMQELLSKTITSLLKRYFSDADKIFRYKFEGTFAMICPMKKEKEVDEQIDKVVKNLNAIVKSDLPGVEAPQLLVGSTDIGLGDKDVKDFINPVLKKLNLTEV